MHTPYNYAEIATLNTPARTWGFFRRSTPLGSVDKTPAMQSTEMLV